jgi:hypothetical protein
LAGNKKDTPCTALDRARGQNNLSPGEEKTRMFRQILSKPEKGKYDFSESEIRKKIRKKY